VSPGPAAPGSDLIVVTEHLSRSFGALAAVRDVSLQVRRGEIFGVLGPNGAGKSTTIRMLCGILDPSGGKGTVVGFDLKKDPERIKERIGYMTQRFSLYEDLSVQENLVFYAGLYGLSGSTRRVRVEEVLGATGLGDRRKQIAGTLSGGWKQRVALACSTIHRPPLLFLDEPTAGVDPVSRRDFWEQIHRLAAEGTTVLVTTHYMDEAERCHRLCFIFGGVVLDTGTPEEIVARRGLRVAELQLDDARAASEALRLLPEVDEVAHYGHVLRLACRAPADPEALCRKVAQEHGLQVLSSRPARTTVEDAFVSMVRADEAARRAAA
jgi:ABC-2 type transport system ATP-binding protein